jgi:tRNA(Ile)-lysidine synthase
MRIDGSVLAAVSGGCDSVAMLRMLIDSNREVAAAHYNHGLRDEAEKDENFVRELCGQWGIPFISERGDVHGGAGFEERARTMRYDFLERVRAGRGLDFIATGHTADDNIETVLLNLTRGSGLHGLTGIPEQRGNIIRPILHLSRDDAERYLRERNIPWREDATNADTHYRRNHIRHKVIPALRQVNPSLTRAAVRLTAALREDEEYLMGLAREEFYRCGTEFPAKSLLNLPKPVAVRVCRLLAEAAGGKPPERVHIEAMLDIAAGGNGRETHMAGGLTAAKKKGFIHIYLTNRKRRGLE